MTTLFFSQNDTGLSIRFSTDEKENGTWHRLYLQNSNEQFGQYTTFISALSNSSKTISHISIRLDQIELANVSMPYYLCLHGRAGKNETADDNDDWNGCTYLHPPLANKTGSIQEYPLRDAQGKAL